MAGPNLYVMAVTRGHSAAGSEPRIKAVQNVYVFKRTVGGGAPSLSQFQTAFKTNVLTPLQACLSVSYLTDFLDTRFLDDPLNPFFTTALALNGTVAGDSLPSINNVAVQLKTGFRGRSNRGSKHYGPIAESDTLLDDLTAGAQANWATFLTAYQTGFVDAGGFTWQPFLVSQKASTFNPTTAIVIGNLVTNMRLNITLGQMKRRKQPS